MKIIIFISFILSVLLCSGQKKFLSEEEFIYAVKKYHPVAKQAALGVRIAEAEMTASRGYFDPVLSTDNAKKEWDGTTYYNQRQTEIKIPVWYGIDLYAGKEDVNGSRLNPEDTKGSLTYMGFSVPLLQNLVMDKRRAALKQAKVFRGLSEVQRRIAVNDLLLEATKMFWDWWEQYHVNQLMQSSLQNAEKRFEMVKTAYRLGDRAAIDTLEAFTQIQSFAIRQNATSAALVKAQLQLSAFLWTESQSQYDLPADVVPQEWRINKFLTLEDLLKTASLNPELTQYQFKLSAQEIDKRLKLQLLLPQVNLKYNQTGYNFSKTVNNAWFQNNYRFGFSFSMPLRLSQARGEYRKAKLKIDQTRLEQVNKQVQIYTKIKAYYTDLQQTTAQLLLQNSLTVNIAALQKGEETRLSNGESSLFLVNARELKTIETMQKLIELKSKNRKALIALKWSAGLFSDL